MNVLREAIRSWHRHPITLREFYLAATLLPFIGVAVGWTGYLIYAFFDVSYPSVLGRALTAFSSPAFFTAYALPGYVISLLLLFPLSRRLRSNFSFHLVLALWPIVVVGLVVLTFIPIVRNPFGGAFIALALFIGYAWVAFVVLLFVLARITGILREPAAQREANHRDSKASTPDRAPAAG